MRLYVPDLVQEHSRVQVDQTTLRIHALQVAKQLVPRETNPGELTETLRNFL